MINLIIFGAPGAGKGTQAKKIAEKYNLHHLSTGDLFRREISNKTDLGLKVEDYTNKGALVPDSLVIEMLKREVERHPQSLGFIFDGFPRNTKQAEKLDEMLKEKQQKITAVLVLDVENDELIKRIKNRAKNSNRPDDKNVEVINNRLQIYKDNTYPVLDYYQKQNKVYKIDGLGEIDDITNKLSKIIDNLL